MVTFWLQVAAQMSAFILFMTILRLFAWRPILQFLEDRRDKIRADLEGAERVKAEAEALEADLRDRLAAIEDEARLKIQEAAAAGRKAAEGITEQARADGKAIRAHAQEMAGIEFAKAMQQVKEDMVRMTMIATERLLREKVDETRDREMVGRFLDELERN